MNSRVGFNISDRRNVDVGDGQIEAVFDNGGGGDLCGVVLRRFHIKVFLVVGDAILDEGGDTPSYVVVVLSLMLSSSSAVESDLREAIQVEPAAWLESGFLEEADVNVVVMHHLFELYFFASAAVSIPLENLDGGSGCLLSVGSASCVIGWPGVVGGRSAPRAVRALEVVGRGSNFSVVEVGALLVPPFLAMDTFDGIVFS